MSHSNGAVIAEIAARLLNHFGTTEEPLAVRKAIAHDWVEDLSEFTVPQVEWAAKEWRRNQSMRPTIADIRRLATQAQQNDIKARAITDRNALDAETLRLWDRPEYEGDRRSPQQRRAAAIEAQEERYRRAAARRAESLNKSA